MLSGPRIDLAKFREGWLLAGFGRAHFFTRDDGGFRAKCGYRLPQPMRDGKGFVAFEPGQFSRCQRCLREAKGD